MGIGSGVGLVNCPQCPDAACTNPVPVFDQAARRLKDMEPHEFAGG